MRLKVFHKYAAYLIGVIVCSFMAFFSFSDVHAAQVTNVLGVSDVRKDFQNSEYYQYNGPAGTIPYLFAMRDGPYLGIKTWVVAVSTGETKTGKYYNGSATITLNINNTNNSITPGWGYYCNRITGVQFYPFSTTGSSISYSTNNANVTSCEEYSNPDIRSMSTIQIKISATGQLTSSASFDAYRIHILSSDNLPFLEYITSASDAQLRARIVFEGLNVDFNVSDDASTETLGQISQGIEQINNTTTHIDNYLRDDTPPSADTSVLSGSAGWLPPGPVDSILTLPTQLLGGIVNAFTNPGNCSPIILPLPWVNYNLEIPCLRSYFDITGFTVIWDAVGGIIGAFVIWETLKWLYEFVDKTLSFREDNSSLWGGL